ncbi:unnamed protein product [Vitrella brassicaformis CCMP3155]|uniref:RNA helicase n=2 Tax=Vitrella brassicaformis TaxID=1169539 RepID=A0A0G4F6R0_VITBC|nr:unnamed protein product [Vitrella brassicaformis CCMP3155]|mmetsp:Transcript_47881/g.119787  ORF Transcript_47881/g.119787 Transcript_47881/m.119787 type:complete len:439 (+) Transcript_47881:176-1492(+)|eukprot:CEM08121.1 unnamed protein product [Vitrella brassicaformis CCMP3155]
MDPQNNANETEELDDYEEDEQGQTEAKNGTEGGVEKAGYVGVHATGFKDFFLREELLRAINDAGFEHPSEVQHECIPHAVANKDILCQAKSGMGKTAVFVIGILHASWDIVQNKDTADASKNQVTALVLAHTRELAYQIKNEFERFGKFAQGLRIDVFYGGVPIEQHKTILKDDSKRPHILIGTPGRINQLIREKHLNVDHLKYFVLDECDKCLDKLDMRKDVQNIFIATPQEKQVMMFSATLKGDIRDVCRKFMRNPVEIFIDDESKLTLHGLLQYYVQLTESEKNRKLNDLLDNLEFNQVIIFVKSVSRAKALNKLLTECNFPSTVIHSDMKQEERIKRYTEFKKFEKRILVSTDLMGRGIDIERVNIVVNYDMPDDSNQYLHRVGRAGRFGTKGLAVSFTSTEADTAMLNEIQARFEVKIGPMPDKIDTHSYISS